VSGSVYALVIQNPSSGLSSTAMSLSIFTQ
jgi:hypothetical protein